jgi:hypothetical protein
MAKKIESEGGDSLAAQNFLQFCTSEAVFACGESVAQDYDWLAFVRSRIGKDGAEFVAAAICEKQFFFHQRILLRSISKNFEDVLYNMFYAPAIK